jgi:hypothetical protein
MKNEITLSEVIKTKKINAESSYIKIPNSTIEIIEVSLFRKIKKTASMILRNWR